MWAYVTRRLLYNIPVYIFILLLLFVALRVNDPVYAYLGKQATLEDVATFKARMGLDKPVLVQFGNFLWDVVRLDFQVQSWNQPGLSVGEIFTKAIIPSLLLTAPALLITTVLAIGVGLVSSFYRGRFLDKSLVLVAVTGMCVSFLVYIIMGQYFGAYRLNEFLYGPGREALFAVKGYEGISEWPKYCLLPVLISVIVAMGYDTRFYRAVMVEECNRDYIVTAQAKGASKWKIMFVHMLKNAMIPIITRVMTTLPFLITGSFLLEMYFGIPGMGKELLGAIAAKDFPVIQVFTAMFAALFIATNILTDVMYALVDPRVRLS